MPASPRRSLTAAALVRAQAVIESFDMAGSGAVAYGRRIIQGNAYASHLWLTSWEGARARQLTHGAVRDTAPAWSPDGRRLAFLRTPVRQPGADSAAPTTQVWLLTAKRTDARPWQLTRLPHGVRGLRWSPDSRTLALVAETGDERFVVGGQRPGVTPTARRITATDWRDDDASLAGRRHHLFTVEVRRGARPEQLTEGDFDAGEPAWSADGALIAFTTGVASDWNVDPRMRICAVPSMGGAVRLLVDWQGDAHRPAFSPDGQWLAFAGVDHPDPPDESLLGLWVQRVDAGQRRCLTDGLDRAVEGGAWADLALAEDAPGPLWLSSTELVVLVGTNGRNLPYRARLDGESAEPLTDPALRVVGSGLGISAGRIGFSAAVDGHASEVFALADGRLRPLTDNGSSWQRRVGRPELTELEIAGPGGPIQVWLASPPNAGDAPLPTVIHFHGGPTGCWAPGGTMDSTLLTAHGYRVAMPNIRGSATHGSAWIAALGGRWGDVDAADALAVTDALIARRLSDSDRIGLLGLSYGGFLVQWLVGVSDRFAAAVTENGVANQLSEWASSYFGVHYNRRARLGDPLSSQGVDQLWATSDRKSVV